jgi:hypothetical protein
VIESETTTQTKLSTFGFTCHKTPSTPPPSKKTDYSGTWESTAP